MNTGKQAKNEDCRRKTANGGADEGSSEPTKREGPNQRNEHGYGRSNRTGNEHVILNIFVRKPEETSYQSHPEGHHYVSHGRGYNLIVCPRISIKLGIRHNTSSNQLFSSSLIGRRDFACIGSAIAVYADNRKQ